ncbi:MAG TPA: hypothetical protein VN883_17950 [Myxococcales bacterium]|nr:hypothetical protein [Myxococcales bacterium]
MTIRPAPHASASEIDPQQLANGGASNERRLKLAARVVFLVLLGGSLALWTHLRMPRDLRIDVDLSSALPGQLAEVEVVIAQDGQAVVRKEMRYGPSGAPGALHLEVRARPGDFDVEITLVDRAHRAQRTRRRVRLREGETAVVRVEWQEISR